MRGDAYSLARWLTRNRTDADDVWQEACIRALGAIRQHKGENSRAWVLATVRNTAYTWLDRKRSSMLVGIDDLAEKERIEIELGKERAEATTDPESEMIARAETSAANLFVGATFGCRR